MNEDREYIEDILEEAYGTSALVGIWGVDEVYSNFAIPGIDKPEHATHYLVGLVSPEVGVDVIMDCVERECSPFDDWYLTIEYRDWYLDREYRKEHDHVHQL